MSMEQKVENHSNINSSDLKISNFDNFNSFLIDELEVNLSINLSDDLKNIIKTYLSEYESLNQRKLEEKDSIICQLKQNLVDLTEKRFRTSIQNGTSTLPNENIEFLVNEKEAKINNLSDQLSEYERNISKLKQTIKSQDDVILSLNNNIHEVKNNNKTVLKAKQESFKLMTEDLNAKQKLIEEQNQTILELNEKILILEGELEKAHRNLEKRLNEKQTDLQIKIAQFEANLREGKMYFEDVLAEKTKEITRLKQKLEQLGHIGDDQVQNSDLNNQAINKFETDNIKNIKALYEHQIDILKVKIDMLEKTCTNYQRGIKEMNKNFGIQQLSDEANSIQAFRDLIQEIQKSNVNLETEKIDLQVNNTKLQSLLDQTKIEKENLNKKFQTADQLNQRLSQEKNDLENNYRSIINSKESEIVELNQQISSLINECGFLRENNARLTQISLEYDQLKISNQELTGHYEQLCQQATDIVNGNQMLNDQVQSYHEEIESLKSQVSDLKLEVDHLTNCNSELNTQKVNYELKVDDLEQHLKNIQPELEELFILRGLKLEIESTNKKLNDTKLELEEKNELIEQLIQAKEFLVENNSKLLTNNIKIQLFVESLGLDQSEIENNQRVKEYDDLVDKVSKYENEILDLRIKLEELQCSDRQSLEKETQFDSLTDEIDQLRDKLVSNEKMTQKLKAKLKQLLKKSTIFQDNEAQTENNEYIENLISFGTRMAQEKIEKDVLGCLDALKHDIQCLLLSKTLIPSKSSNTSNDSEYKDQIVNLETKLNSELNRIVELETEIEHQKQKIKSMEYTVIKNLETRIEEMKKEALSKDKKIENLNKKVKSKYKNEPTEEVKKLKEFNENQIKLNTELETKVMELIKELKLKDEQIDALSDWGPSLPNCSPIDNDKNAKIEELENIVNCLNKEMEVLRMEKQYLERSYTEVLDKLKNLSDLNDEQLFKSRDLEFKIKDLENEIRIKDEQIESVSFISNDIQNKSENEHQAENLKHQILDLQVELNAKNELILSMECKLKSVVQELEEVKINNVYLETELSSSQLTEKETRVENAQLLGSSPATNDESIDLKAHVNQIMIELSIKNEQLASLETFLNEQKIESQRLTDKLTNESENWKKKYETMRLKALALKDKCKKLELNSGFEDGRASPSNSSKSSMDSSSLAEHLFHNLQAEYKEFKKSHEENVNEMTALLVNAQNELIEYKLLYNEDKINDLHRIYTDQLRQYEVNFESIQRENDELKNFKAQFDQLNEKFSQIEKQNLKLKAKVKQVLTKSKEEASELQKISSDKQIQTNLENVEDKNIVLVDAETQSQLLKIISSECQTEENEYELLKSQNEQYKCLISNLEENQITEEIKAELSQLKEKIQTAQDQNLKLKAKLKKIMSSQKMTKTDFECQTEMDNLVQKDTEIDVLQKKVSNFEEMLNYKEKMSQDLKNEVSSLKEFIEKQRFEYENQISALNEHLISNESNLMQVKEELNGLKSQSEISMVSALPNQLMSESLVLDETACTASSNLENQLKFCHEKCEKVVAKLSLLRKQNESLNSKIKTIKSMIAL